MKFDIWEMASGRYAVVALLEKGSETVILSSEDTAKKVKDFAENIFSGEIKDLTINGAGDEGELIVRCDSDKTFTLKLEGKKQPDVAAIAWFIKSVWNKQKE